MRIRGTRIQELLLGLALLAGLVWNVAKATEINHLRLDNGPTGTRAELAWLKLAALKLRCTNFATLLAVCMTSAIGSGEAKLL